mgnify:CR=1 FL=1
MCQFAILRSVCNFEVKNTWGAEFRVRGRWSVFSQILDFSQSLHKHNKYFWKSCLLTRCKYNHGMRSSNISYWGGNVSAYLTSQNDWHWSHSTLLGCWLDTTNKSDLSNGRLCFCFDTVSILDWIIILCKFGFWNFLDHCQNTVCFFVYVRAVWAFLHTGTYVHILLCIRFSQ